jgi:hypothetical protein
MFSAVSLGQPTEPSPLYVHFGTAWRDSVKRLLSAKIHLGEPVFAGGSDYLQLTGEVVQKGTNLVADLMGSTGGESDVYRVAVTLEKPVFAQGGGASGGTGGPSKWFCVSTNSDCAPLLKKIQALDIGRPHTEPEK